MKKHIISLMLVAACALSAHAGGSIIMNGQTYEVDTVFHNVIGPGTTQTSLWIHNGTLNFRAYYAILDLTNPYLSLEGIVANDNLKGTQMLEKMISKHTREGHRQFLGINGDFFVNDGTTTTRGVRLWGSPLGPTVCNGDIYIAHQNPSGHVSFSLDTQGKAYVSPFRFRGTMTATDGTQIPVTAINPVHTSPGNNAITIYNSHYFYSSDAFGGCEVSARLADGESFHAMGTTRFIVTSEPNTVGDMDIPTNGYVLHARGTAAEAMLAATKVGDELVMESYCLAGEQVIDPDQVISGNPDIVGGGEVLDSEANRSDGTQRHPRTGIGYSEDGNKVFFCVVDGRQTASVGARLSEIGAIMKYAGATDAVNLDGGGSSILYSTELLAINSPSVGHDRSCGNGIFAVYNAPDDDNIVELRFKDYKLTTARYGVYTPHFFGYNKYGYLVDTDVKGVTLTCPEGFGKIKNDTTFFASGIGTQLLTANLGDIKVSMPMVIVGEKLNNMSFMTDSIITDGLRDQLIDVQTTLNGSIMPLSPEALLWESLNSNVLTIDRETGVMRGVSDGTTKVIGTVDGIADTMLVNVEIPKDRVMKADLLDPDTWTMTMRCGKDGVAKPLTDGGFEWNYTGASGRLPNVTMKKTLRLWSLPDTLRLRINNGNVPIKQAVFTLYAGNNHLTSAIVELSDTTSGKDKVIDLPTAQWCDPDDMTNFPITLSGIQLDLFSSTNGAEYKMRFDALETIYSRMPAKSHLNGDLNESGIVDVDDLNLMINIILGLNSASEYMSVADMDGNKIIDVDDVNMIINIILGL